VIETQVTIVNKLGLHARAAAKFVSCASAFSSKIHAGKDGQLIDGKSIMSVMMLAAGRGTVLDLRIDGEDEAAALEAIQSLIENRFGEAE
jgi:phosphocarrier protein